VYLQVDRTPLETMELTPRQVSFVKSEMKRVQEDDARQPTARVEAEGIFEEAETALTE